jgi:uncharacterized repeat protein (TIGR03803 family)
MHKRLAELVGACLSVAILSACGGGNSGLYSSTSVAPHIAAPQSAAAGSAPTYLGSSLEPQPLIGTGYKSLYKFKGGADGASPKNSALIAVNGHLYGMSSTGGTGCGCGTVFEVGTSGAESVLYSFKGGSSDGASPRGGLINVNGTLYGTTEQGGAYGNGTFFKITTSGSESMLYSFGTGGAADAAYPYAHLIFVKGLFYGTTIYGGSSSSCPYGCGTVFSVTRSGNEHVLYSFNGGVNDGDFLTGSLLYKSGELYGTTQLGGGGCASGGCGTVFSVSTSGTEKTLYSFTGGSDGFGPDAGLINVNGTLYGMTGGSPTSCSSSGSLCGTVFSVSTSGTEKTLYTFGGGTDGRGPFGNLTDVNGVLYGTTTTGGGSGCGSSNEGCGTIFKVSTHGAEHVLYRFKGSPDGADPQTTLVDVNGMLYGATDSGGSGCGSSGGCGTVFKIKP